MSSQHNATHPDTARPHPDGSRPARRSSSEDRRAVITGMGAITPSGHSVDDLWESVSTGRSAITLLDGDGFADLPVRIGGRIIGFDAATFLPRPLARRLSPVQHWAIAAADQALAHAGIRPAGADPAGAATGPPADLPWPAEKFAIIVATGSGPIDAMQQATRSFDSRGPQAVPFTLAVYGSPDSVAGLLAERYGARGPSEAISATCASGAVALGAAMRQIRHGYADAVLVVGMEDCLGPINLASNARLGALAAGFEDDPTSASRPFDQERRGFVMSAGAGAILLESASARAGRADDVPGSTLPAPLAEVAGFGSSSDAHHPTAPPEDGHGAALAMRLCLADADVPAEQVDHINAHGTATPLGDAAEIAALHTVFGDRGRDIPISATKSSTGHLLGAAGVVEAIIAVETMRHRLLPPTINLDNPAFPDWNFVRGSARPEPVANVLSTSFGFGGHNGALLLRRWSPIPSERTSP